MPSQRHLPAILAWSTTLLALLQGSRTPEQSGPMVDNIGPAQSTWASFHLLSTSSQALNRPDGRQNCGHNTMTNHREYHD